MPSYEASYGAGDGSGAEHKASMQMLRKTMALVLLGIPLGLLARSPEEPSDGTEGTLLGRPRSPLLQHSSSLSFIFSRPIRLPSSVIVFVFSDPTSKSTM